MLKILHQLGAAVLDLAFVGFFGFCLFCLQGAFGRRVKTLSFWALPRVTRLALGVLALAAVFAVAKQGGTNGADRAGAPARTVRRVAVEAGTEPVEALRFTSIVRTPSNVAFTVHSPSNGTDDGYDVFMRPRLESRAEVG